MLDCLICIWTPRHGLVINVVMRPWCFGTRQLVLRYISGIKPCIVHDSTISLIKHIYAMLLNLKSHSNLWPSLQGAWQAHLSWITERVFPVHKIVKAMSHEHQAHDYQIWKVKWSPSSRLEARHEMSGLIQFAVRNMFWVHAFKTVDICFLILLALMSRPIIELL